MSQTHFYYQCTIRKVYDSGPWASATVVVHLPAEYCVKGTFIKIKKDEVWDDGWEVLAVGKRTDGPTVIAMRDTNKQFKKVLKGN